MDAGAITKVKAIACIFLVLAPLILCEMVGSIFTGIATENGLLVYRNNSKYWFLSLTLFYVLMLIISVFEASRLWL
jgi:hypothetical protein